MKEKIRLDGIKTAESPVITGVVEGPSETVMAWKPHQMTGVETPPEPPRPGRHQARERRPRPSRATRSPS